MSMNCICSGEPTACRHYETGSCELSGYPCTCCAGCSMFEPAEGGEKMSKDELIEEITDQLNALSLVADKGGPFKLSETLALFDLQFRLKCKLYELSNNKEV